MTSEPLKEPHSLFSYAQNLEDGLYLDRRGMYVVKISREESKGCVYLVFTRGMSQLEHASKSVGKNRDYEQILLKFPTDFIRRPHAVALMRSKRVPTIFQRGASYDTFVREDLSLDDEGIMEKLDFALEILKRAKKF